jgi:hypothetical protein
VLSLSIASARHLTLQQPFGGRALLVACYRRDVLSDHVSERIRSPEPLVRPEPSEREGYVPNVVYTCGALRQGERIILPYSVSDTFSNFATIGISVLLDTLTG